MTRKACVRDVHFCKRSITVLWQMHSAERQNPFALPDLLHWTAAAVKVITHTGWQICCKTNKTMPGLLHLTSPAQG